MKTSTEHLTATPAITRYPDYQPDAEGFWTLDLLEAVVAGEPAGYLKISYISAAIFRRQLPDALCFTVRRQRAFLGLDQVPLSRPVARWTDRDLVQAIRATHPYAPSAGGLQTLSRADLERLWARESKQIIRAITPEYERFRDYWLDRPQVEAVRVRSDGDSSMLSGGVRRPVASPLDFRRRGIALALYRQAALWMGERGLSLHASSLQSPEAARAWASLERAGLVITERSGYGERRRLDAARVKEESGLAAQIPTLHHGHRRLVESASERDEVGLG